MSEDTTHREVKLRARQKIVSRCGQAISVLTEATKFIDGLGNSFDEGFEQACLETVIQQLRAIRERLE